MQQRIDERLLEQFSSAQLDTAWMNREESIKEGILEEGGSLNDDMPPFHQRQMEFHNLAQDEIRFWIDYGPYTVHDFQD